MILRKIIIIMGLVFFLYGCNFIGSEDVVVGFNKESKNLEKKCIDLLNYNLTQYLICNSWDIESKSISDIIRISKKMGKSADYSAHNSLTPLEHNLKIIKEFEGRFFIFYPNGYFVRYSNKELFEKRDLGEGYEGDIYTCLVKECLKYFKWSFESEDHENKFESSDQFQYKVIEKYIASIKKYSFDNEKVKIKDKKCTFYKDSKFESKCLYYFLDGFLFIYSDEISYGNTFIEKIKVFK